MLESVPREEVNRKILHIFVVILPLSVFYGPTISGISPVSIIWITVVLLVLSIAVEILRVRNAIFGKYFCRYLGSMLRDEEKTRFTGATYVLAATFLCAFFSNISEGLAACSCIALILFILGDAIAALVGKSFGRIRIGQKTLEGAIACFVLSSQLAYWLFPQLPGFLEKWGGVVTLLQALSLGFSVALLELFPIKFGKMMLNDNLYVPVLVTFIAFFLR
jgi:dolichol kinase